MNLTKANLKSTIVCRDRHWEKGVGNDKTFVCEELNDFVTRVNGVASTLIQQGYVVQPVQYPDVDTAIITYMEEVEE